MCKKSILKRRNSKKFTRRRVRDRGRQSDSCARVTLDSSSSSSSSFPIDCFHREMYNLMEYLPPFALYTRPLELTDSRQILKGRVTQVKRIERADDESTRQTEEGVCERKREGVAGENQLNMIEHPH